MKYNKTVEKVEIEKFMGRWYVQAGRLTFLEKGAHNAVETYTLSKDEDDILIEFSFKKNSFDGPTKNIPQKGWIQNRITQAHWKVSPLWPLRFDYLIIDLADDYSWTAIGVPNQKYLWIMSREWDFSDSKVKEILARLKEKGYDAENTIRVPQKW